MPLSTERVPNTPLSGVELQELILKRIEEVLSRDGLFSPYVAFGRVGWEATVRLHLDNPTYREHLATIQSHQGQGSSVPLSGASEESSVVAFKVEDSVESPNLARAAAGMPISVVTRQGGELVRREIQYDPDELPEIAAPTVTDLTAETRKEWKLPEAPEPPEPSEVMNVVPKKSHKKT